MTKNTVHTSRDLFDEDKTNIFDPASSEMIGQVTKTATGINTASTRTGQYSMFNDMNEAYGHLKRVKRPRTRQKSDSWGDRMKQYHSNFDKYKTL